MTRTAPPPQREAENSSPWRQKWFVRAAVFLALVILASAAVLIFGPGDEEDRPPVVEEPAAQVPAEPSGSQPASACAVALFSSPPLIPQGPPTTDGWRRIGRVLAPFSADHGPAGEAGGCFAHSPTGAVFAAANFLAAATDPVMLEVAVQERTAPGQGRDVILYQLTCDPAVDPDCLGPGYVTGTGAPFQLAGFTVLTYSEQLAAVAIVVRGDSGGLAAVPVTLTWDDTWQVNLPADGDLAGQAQQVTSLTGYEPWSA